MAAFWASLILPMGKTFAPYSFKKATRLNIGVAKRSRYGDSVEKLIEMLRRHEGVKSHSYLCSEGFETIGVGRNISESGLGLSDDEINYLLMNDVARVKEELTDEYFWFPALGEVRQAAMIDISFNIGQTRLRGFVRALKAMADENFDQAADEFYDSRWASQVGSRAEEICNMIRTGEYQ